MGKTLTILAHGDSDGVCSAAIAKAALSSRYDEVKVFFTHPAGLLEDLTNFASGDLIIVDVAINETHVENIRNYLRNYGGEVTYIDHHPPPLNTSVEDLGFTETYVDYVEEASTSELTYRKYRKELSKDFDRVALYGAIADYADVTPWVEEALSRWDKRQIYFEAGILSQGLENSRKLYNLKRDVVNHLSKNLRPSTHEELLKRALNQTQENEKLLTWVEQNVRIEGRVAYVLNPPGSIPIAAIYTLRTANTEVGIAGEVRNDLIVMSLRTTNKKLNLNNTLRKITPTIGGSGGGHKNAAGARIPKENLSKLIELLNEELKRTQQT
ncbi:MAG: hypothetical protein B7O98_01675 [Zestosphaera tikiterensis]|uniref:Uncharacterized protein n=1 Tax=Zestosphaera tikiterensis TaxID=1973259 RepID=A0A2R7Y829_9CREN|nr:MAG: hypothetical protein B7O98_01675 [Zestosphaera tikiterensis]